MSDSPWGDYAYSIKRVVVRDEINPVNMDHWFYYLSYCEYLDVGFEWMERGES